ncbi:hypothetical protein JM47_01225 [Ureaplasma diversum]|uniref:Lipoprotein n=1 Tax=Ureaplasma diversum TaxID=42094 RepID=A0A0C5RKR5_9BACT|nr:hypothetical protein [Ureaplasma diversum]AJQ45243.1 hypothetical protein JM47_01225 [Ureaplasma diversum]
MIKHKFKNKKLVVLLSLGMVAVIGATAILASCNDNKNTPVKKVENKNKNVTVEANKKTNSDVSKNQTNQPKQDNNQNLEKNNQQTTPKVEKDSSEEPIKPQINLKPDDKKDQQDQQDQQPETGLNQKEQGNPKDPETKKEEPAPEVKTPEPNTSEQNGKPEVKQEGMQEKNEKDSMGLGGQSNTQQNGENSNPMPEEKMQGDQADQEQKVPEERKLTRDELLIGTKKILDWMLENEKKKLITEEQKQLGFYRKPGSVKDEDVYDVDFGKLFNTTEPDKLMTSFFTSDYKNSRNLLNVKKVTKSIWKSYWTPLIREVFQEDSNAIADTILTKTIPNFLKENNIA